MIVVGGLLLVAFVVGLVLWVTMSNDDSSGFAAATTTAPDTTPVVAATPTAAAITSVRTFDPEGDQVERDEFAPNAMDNDLSTAWTTVCYSSKFLGGKQGVGVIADLGSNGTGTFTVALGSAPYQVKVFAAPDGSVPTSFSAWGSPIDSFNGVEATDLSVELTTPARFVLVSFNELGTDPACTDNPYRGVIKELSFS